MLSEGRNTVSLVDKKGADAGVLRFSVAGHGLFDSRDTGGHRQSAYGTSGVAAGAGATGLAAGAGTAALAGLPLHLSNLFWLRLAHCWYLHLLCMRICAPLKELWSLERVIGKGRELVGGLEACALIAHIRYARAQVKMSWRFAKLASCKGSSV